MKLNHDIFMENVMIKQNDKKTGYVGNLYKQPVLVTYNHTKLLKQHDNNFHKNKNYSYNLRVFTENNIYNTPDGLPLQGGNYREKNQFVEVNKMDVLQRYHSFLCGEYTKKTTIRQYMTSARQFIQHTKGVINQETMTNYRHHLNNNYKKTNSIRIRLHGANLLLKHMGYTERYKLPREQITNQHTLTEQQIDTLLRISQVNPELHLILLLLWDGCIRNSSIINLKTSDRQENRLQLNNTKTGDRHIIMSKALQNAWTNYLIHRPQAKPEHSNYLFIRTNGERYKDIYHITETIRRLGIITGLTQKITPYTIRRTSATLRQNKFSKYYAGDPKIVQMMFNHTDIKTTMRYNQKTDNDIQEYLDVIYADKQDQAIYQGDIRKKTHDKSYLPADQDIIKCGGDNHTVSFSYTIIFFGGIFLEKMIQSSRDATEFFPLMGIGTEDKDWDGIRNWMEMHHAEICCLPEL